MICVICVNQGGLGAGNNLPLKRYAPPINNPKHAGANVRAVGLGATVADLAASGGVRTALARPAYGNREWLHPYEFFA
jgi:hypothetical protein